MSTIKVNLQGGEVFAIPLFLPYGSDNQRFKKSDFIGNDKKFAFCRVISDMQCGGIFIEVFSLVGNLSSEIGDILSSPRLFPPVSVTGLGFYKKRWILIYQQDPYDKEQDSNYSHIQLVVGYEPPFLWQNGVSEEISIEESKLYERWQIWSASHLEKRIIETLKEKGVNL
ncbi:immunity 26/phosphotriesterase HocA family protein [Pasteurellaceae bacterium LIM206]|nr:immunity 26/phosphotriesterase HocA family protein [Pasteurellaceae bacterium LIM206]